MGFLIQPKRSLFYSNYFDRAIRSAHPFEEVLDRKSFEAHHISHHPTKHTITPNSSLQQLRCWRGCYCCCCCSCCSLLTASQRGASFSPPASSAHRHPMAAVRAIDAIFAQHSCCCARFGDSRRSPMPQPRR